MQGTEFEDFKDFAYFLNLGDYSIKVPILCIFLI